ncbi:MAG: MATE family efflux transporter [Eubacteriales bacterium]
MNLIKTFKHKFIGDKNFYRMLLVLVIPIVIQQGITNFVSLLDNLMVGRLGTLHMSAVSIANQLMFVFSLTIFGGLSGASIFGTQFFGNGDYRGMRDTFRFKMYFSIITTLIAIFIFIFWGEDLIMLFLKSESNSAEEIAETLSLAKAYLDIALVGLIPFAIVQTYSGTLRETGETISPMLAGVAAIVVNLIFNLLLIFGLCGFPKMGVRGAAVATVISRFVELIIVLLATHLRAEKFPFIKGAYRSLHVPLALVKKIAITGTPLLINELLWSLGTTFINQNYSVRGLGVVAAANITSTAWNLFCIIMFSMGSAVSILVGQKLGAGDEKGAIDVDTKLLFVTVVSHIVIALLIIASAPFIPLLYNVEPEVQSLATTFLMIAGASLPVHALIHNIYFTIRSGGKTIITFLFDSVFTWAVPAMISLVMCRFTSVDIIWIYFAVQFSEAVKLFIGIPMLKSGFWAKCVITDVSEKTNE